MGSLKKARPGAEQGSLERGAESTRPWHKERRREREKKKKKKEMQAAKVRRNEQERVKWER